MAVFFDAAEWDSCFAGNRDEYAGELFDFLVC
jgi:hypothetical protein